MLYFEGANKLARFVEEGIHDAIIDELIAKWVQEQWEKGRPLCHTSAALCGIQYFAPWLRGKLVESWRSFHTWRRLEVPLRSPPMPPEFLYSIANFALHQNDLVFASLLILGFEGLLRTGELLKLRPCDIVVRNGQCLVRLEDTKTSGRKAATEVVHFDHPWGIEVIRALLELLKFPARASLPIWPASSTFFRQRFKSYLKHFGMKRCGFRPYSLRRGGATTMFLAHQSYDLAIQKGRWQSVKAARVYIQDGLSQLPRLMLPDPVLAYISSWHPFATPGQVQEPWKGGAVS